MIPLLGMPNRLSHMLLASISVLVLSGCTLSASQKPAALQVTSTPQASVFLDGKHIGKTPFYSDQLRAGEHTLKITVSEASFVEKITLTPGTLTVVNRELANNFLAQAGEKLWLEPNGKGLFIISSPDQADITLDGKLLGKTPLFVQDIQEGDHKLLASKPGYVQRKFAIKTSKRYELFANITLASEIAKGIVQHPPSPPPTKKIEISGSPQALLKVRKEPLSTSVEVGSVKKGQQLEFIQETEGWMQVSFEGKLGWIPSQYAKKL